MRVIEYTLNGVYGFTDYGASLLEYTLQSWYETDYPGATEIRVNALVEGVMETPSPEYDDYLIKQAVVVAAGLRAEQAADVIAAGFTLNSKVTPINDLLYFIQLAQAGKVIIEAGDVSTTTVTIQSTSGSYEADLTAVNKILAGLEAVRSKSIKVEMGEVIISGDILPLVI